MCFHESLLASFTVKPYGRDAIRRYCPSVGFWNPAQEVMSAPPFGADGEMSILPKLVRWKDHARMKLWPWDEKNLPSITDAARTAVAATASVIIARLVQMPEAYWAAIATLVVMQSTLGATLTLSIARIVATAVGASIGALEAHFFGANLFGFALAILLTGLFSIWFRLEKTAYRYAGITLAIVVLIPRSASPWAIALHRFIEVSVGIVVALAFVALWPERPLSAANRVGE
jgi:uncharacterized membrane protein YccC